MNDAALDWTAGGSHNALAESPQVDGNRGDEVARPVMWPAAE